MNHPLFVRAKNCHKMQLVFNIKCTKYLNIIYKGYVMGYWHHDGLFSPGRPWCIALTWVFKSAFLPNFRPQRSQVNFFMMDYVNLRVEEALLYEFLVAQNMGISWPPHVLSSCSGLALLLCRSFWHTSQAKTLMPWWTVLAWVVRWP